MKKFWNIFTDPATSIKKPEEQRKARMLSGLLVFLIPLTLIGVYFSSEKYTFYHPVVLLMWSAVALFVAAFALSRTKYYKSGSIITVYTNILLPFAAYILKDDYTPLETTNSLIWVLIGILLGSILLSLRNVIIMAFTSTLAIMVLPILITEIAFNSVLLSLGIVNSISVLIIVFAAIRKKDFRQIEAQTHQIKESEETIRLYASTVENMQIGLYVFDLNDAPKDQICRLIAANPAAAKITGKSTEEVMDKCLTDIFNGVKEEKVMQQLKEVIQTGNPVEIEELYYGHGGEISGVLSIKAFSLPENHLGLTFENISVHRMANKQQFNEALFLALVDNMLPKGNIFVKTDKQIAKININDIYWVRAMENYIVINTSGDKHIVLQPLSKFQKKLPQKGFLRVHRSFLVNLNKISSIRGNEIMIQDSNIPIGATYKKELIEKLNLI